MPFTVFSLFKLFFSCGGERKPTWNAGHCFARKFSNFQILLRHPRLAFDWLSVSFFDYWPIRMSGLLLLCTELTLFCSELPENCIYLNQSELSNFFMYLIILEKLNFFSEEVEGFAPALRKVFFLLLSFFLFRSFWTLNTTRLGKQTTLIYQ